MSRLAIITTHPIQYNAPLFRLLAKEEGILIKVFYTWSQRQNDFFDHTFGKEIKWDIPLLEVYEYEFIENISKNPNSHHYKGIINPNLIDKINEWQASHVLIYGWKFHSHYRALKYFKGRIPVLFRGDSTLLDYDYCTLSDIWKNYIKSKKLLHTNDINLQKKAGVRFFLKSTISLIKYQLRHQLLKKVFKNIDTVFYVGSENKKYFLKYGLKESQLKFAPHAIENERFFDNQKHNYEIDASKWRKELGYEKDDLVLLFAGKFENKKSPLLLIQTVQKHNQLVKQENNSLLKLLLVGNGPLEDSIKKIALHDKNIQILPFQNQSKMPLLYRIGDVFCLPSQGPNETWGLAINEAMACERPAIVSNKVGCSSDLIIENKTGWSFNKNDTTALLEIFKYLNKNNLNNMRPKIKEYIQPWSLENVIKSIKKEIDCLEK